MSARRVRLRRRVIGFLIGGALGLFFAVFVMMESLHVASFFHSKYDHWEPRVRFHPLPPLVIIGALYGAFPDYKHRRRALALATTLVLMVFAASFDVFKIRVGTPQRKPVEIPAE